MRPLPPKPRNAAIVILLCIVTLGVYWFVWNYKAFKELGDHRGLDMKASTWVPWMAVLYAGWFLSFLGGVGYYVAQAVGEFGLEDERVNEIAIERFEANMALNLALAAVMVALLLVQLLYHLPATHAVAEAAKSSGVTGVPNAALAVVFNILLMIGTLPIPLTEVASLVGIVLAVIWIAQVQKALNAYWAATQPGATSAAWPQPAVAYAAPPQSLTAAPPASPVATAPPAVEPWRQPPSQEPTVEKTFACPDCGAHVTVNYVPGQPLPVQCPRCGTKGQVR